MEYKVVIAGDTFPTESNMDLFVEGNGEQLFGEEILTFFQRADVRIVNCEGSFFEKDTAIKKSGPIIGATPGAIKGLECLNPTLISMANNHSLDYGLSGYQLTKELMARHNLACIGIGDNLEEAAKPYIMETPIGKIGIYACAEYEFTIATETKCGVNPYDPLESFDAVEQLRHKVDYLIVIYHGGKEHYRYPTPMLQKVCRKFVDKGADFVVANHSHCIGSMEKYKQAEILYGQGNFLFDRSTNEFRNTGLLVEITLNAGEKLNAQIRYVPVKKAGNTVRMAEDKEILEAFIKRNEEIKEIGFVEAKYEEFVRSHVVNYIEKLSGKSKFHRGLRKIFRRGENRSYKYLRKTYNYKQVLSIINIFRCQAHYELVCNMLVNSMKEELNENR